ncbi:MAG: condensation domain-containing protein [Eubacteriales bacterium]|nr:condensation domain-containing protein [Eubacteriales bacterium]
MERQYVRSERAHLMCPQMHFGIFCTISLRYDEQKLLQTLDTLAEAHPFLKCLIADDENGSPFYSVQAQSQIRLNVSKSPQRMSEDYQALSTMGWNVYTDGLLQVIVYPGDDGFDILWVAHHLLCDGRGLLSLVQSFADCYGKGSKPVYVEERLLQSMDDLPKGSNLPWISRLIIEQANRRWKEEKQKVHYSEYQAFEKNYNQQKRLDIQIERKSPQELAKLVEQCHESGVSLNDYLVAQMMLKHSTKKVIIAADIREDLTLNREGSLGNFSTAFSVTCKAAGDDCVKLAKHVARQTKACLQAPRKKLLVLACYFRMNPELMDAVAISTLGGYPSKAGLFVGTNLFGYQSGTGYSLSNLGKITSDILLQAVFIPAASPANQENIGVLTVNDRMSVCTVRPIRTKEKEHEQ